MVMNIHIWAPSLQSALGFPHKCLSHLAPTAHYITVVFGEVEGQVLFIVCTPVLLLWMVD